jgi:DHA2 family multidrug resistance protein
MSDAIPAKAPEHSDLTAWLAVAAGTIGAFMALLDTSIVNASLPTIQGEIGASGAEGTWVSTAYLVAEIIMIPLTGWFQRMLGLRTFLMISTVMFALFSLTCGLAAGLTQMILGRIGQGFFGGAMIPTAMTIVITRLSEKDTPIGLALFGFTAVLGPVLGPLIGGWLTENLSWHYVFFINLPVAVGLLALLYIGIPHRRIDLGEIFDADLLGIVGLMLGLGCLTVVLEEGQRELWFESGFIRLLSTISLLGFGLLILGQFVSTKPVIALKLVVDRSFGSVMLLMLAVGASIFGLLYILPQFLANVSGYNSEQSGLVTAATGIPMVVMLAVYPILSRLIDVRVAIASGLLLFAGGCYINMHVTADTGGGQFFVPQLMCGFGQYFSSVFLNEAARAATPRSLAEDASALFNAARNLGGSFGIAIAGILQDQRLTFHIDRLSEAISSNALSSQAAVATLGYPRIDQMLRGEALVMTYADLYWVFGVMMVGMLPLVLLLKRPAPGQAPAMGH